MDKETWRRIQQGDNQAFNELYYGHINLLYGYGMKIIPNQHIVRECIQSLFIYIWEHRTSIEDPQNWNQYLAVSLRNRMLKNKKKVRCLDIVHTDVGDIEYGFELVPDVQETLVKAEIDIEQLSELEEGLRRLTAREREVIYLRYYKNMSVDDTSAIMGVKIQYIYNTTTQAIKKLRENTGLSKAFLMALVYLFK